MSFVVELFNFSKKENSTKQPDRTGATSFNCTLKKDSGLLNPIIQLDLGLSQAPNYNYAYIPEYDRYYFVKEWVNRQPLWEVALQVDVLATFKTSIGNSDLYVLRASNEYDGNIIDALYPSTIVNSSSVITGSLFTTNVNLGTIVIGVVSDDADFGSITYYATSPYGLRVLLGYLLDDSIMEANGFSLDDASMALQKSLIDPLSYIKSCVYIPYPYADIAGSPTAIHIWDWTTTALAKKIGTNVVVSKNVSFNLSKHPQAQARGAYCNCSPYTNYLLISDAFGEISLDTLYLSDKSSITCKMDIDLINGKGILTTTSNGYCLSKNHTQIGVPIALSQITKDYLGVAQSGTNGVLGTIGNVLTGNVTGAISSATNGIYDSVRAMQPRQSTIGTNGSFINFDYQIKLQTIFYTIVDDDITHNGRPLCKVRKPNALNGYMLIQDGDIDATGATADELQSIRSYLEGGFYYE